MHVKHISDASFYCHWMLVWLQSKGSYRVTKLLFKVTVPNSAYKWFAVRSYKSGYWPFWRANVWSGVLWETTKLPILSCYPSVVALSATQSTKQVEMYFLSCLQFKFAILFFCCGFECNTKHKTGRNVLPILSAVQICRPPDLTWKSSIIYIYMFVCV